MRSDTDRVLDASATLENLLEKMHGASGKGLHEKASSVAHKLDNELIRHLRYIASVRNSVVHERVRIDDTRAFDSAVEKAIDALAKGFGIPTTAFNCTSWKTFGKLRHEEQLGEDSSNITTLTTLRDTKVHHEVSIGNTLDIHSMISAALEALNSNKEELVDAGSNSTYSKSVQIIKGFSLVTQTFRKQIFIGLAVIGAALGFVIGYSYFGIGAGLAAGILAGLFTAIFGLTILENLRIILFTVSCSLLCWLIFYLWNVKF